MATLALTVDEHGREDVKGVVNVPIVDDKLGVKLFGAQIKSTAALYNTTLNQRRGWTMIVQTTASPARWQPTEQL